MGPRWPTSLWPPIGGPNGSGEEPQERADWHRLTLWNRLAQFAQDYVSKGDRVYVEGRLEYDSYERDGVTIPTADVNVRELVLLSPRPGGGSGCGLVGWPSVEGLARQGSRSRARRWASRLEPGPEILSHPEHHLPLPSLPEASGQVQAKDVPAQPEAEAGGEEGGRAMG